MQEMKNTETLLVLWRSGHCGVPEWCLSLVFPVPRSPPGARCMMSCRLVRLVSRIFADQLMVMEATEGTNRLASLVFRCKTTGGLRWMSEREMPAVSGEVWELERPESERIGSHRRAQFVSPRLTGPSKLMIRYLSLRQYGVPLIYFHDG